jgi:methoxymalonate biosynthesis acyl carrier protein
MTTNQTDSVDVFDGKVRADLQEFIHRRTGVLLEADTDLFDRGLISSMFAMELVVHVEETFGVEVDGADLAIDNFRTVRSMTELIRRLRGAGNVA